MRDRIVDVMRAYGRPISPTRISKITGETIGSVAYHVRTLKSAGVVVLADEARVRGSVEHLYALVPTEEKLTLNDPSEVMLSLCGVLMLPGSDEDLPRPVVLDDEARLELRVLLDALTPKVHVIARRSTERVCS